MDKISKVLKKLSQKEIKLVKNILTKLKINSLKGIKVQKLKGHENIFRIKKGKIRIIYKKNKEDKVFILTIERRSDNTYNRF